MAGSQSVYTLASRVSRQLVHRQLVHRQLVHGQLVHDNWFTTTGSRQLVHRQLVHRQLVHDQISLRIFYDMVIAAEREVGLMKILQF